MSRNRVIYQSESLYTSKEVNSTAKTTNSLGFKVPTMDSLLTGRMLTSMVTLLVSTHLFLSHQQ